MTMEPYPDAAFAALALIYLLTGLALAVGLVAGAHAVLRAMRRGRERRALDRTLEDLRERVGP
jgi:hypothetical protein